MVYKWKIDKYKTDAEVAGRVFKQLEDTVGLTADNLVNASRDESAPLHNEFEWDNEVAGERWRKQQARVMIASLVVQVEEIPEAPVVRAFVQVEEDSPKYDSITVIMQDEDKTQALIRRAISELKAFERKYKDIQQFAALFAEIDKLVAA